MRCRRENLANYDGGCCGGSRVEESCCEFIFSAFWLRGDVWGLGFLCGRVVGVWVTVRSDGGWGKDGYGYGDGDGKVGWMERLVGRWMDGWMIGAAIVWVLRMGRTLETWVIYKYRAVVATGFKFLSPTRRCRC